MKKTDKSIKNITIAAIKRHTIKPFDFKYSSIYEKEEQITNEKVQNVINSVLEVGEELICSTIITDNLWTVLTTRKIITLEGVRKYIHSLEGIERRNLGDFKGWAKQDYTKGILIFKDDEMFPFFIECDKASMIMIYGTQTAMKIIS